MTEKRQTNDYPEMRPTFTAAELKDITEFSLESIFNLTSF